MPLQPAEPSFRHSVDIMFNRAAALMDLSPGLEEKIRVCNATYTVRFGVRLRGRIHTFTGYRSVHSEHLEPVKGGIRYAMSVNQDEVEMTDVDLNDTLVLALRNLKEEMSQKHAVVEASLLPVVHANSVYMLQLLQNFISNGIKYNESRIPLVQIGVEDKDDHYLFRVRDNGIGIEPEFHDQVFEMFKRLHTREEYQGTGIGLAMCKKIITKLGGKIWLESEPGKGTTFFFTLPKPQAASASANGTREQASTRTGQNADAVAT